MQCAKHRTRCRGGGYGKTWPPSLSWPGVRFLEIAIIIFQYLKTHLFWMASFLLGQRHVGKIASNLTLFEGGFFFFFKTGGDLEYLLMVILICLSNRGCENWTWLRPDTHDLQGPVGPFILCYSCSGNEGLKAACHLKRWQLFKVLKCSPPLNLLRHSEPSTRNWRSELDSLFAELA